MPGNTVFELMRTRLAASDLPKGARRLALAAVVGEGALRHALESPDDPVTDRLANSAETMPGGVWLRSITLRGFRGVGPAATLTVEPGPGLTLIVGRNGSGKSSFAEGIEIALTGRNDRLVGKTADWQKQWRNIHDGSTAEVKACFQVDGEPRLLTVRRSWNGASIGDAVSAAAWNGGEQRDLSELNWGTALEQYRPFLSYDDLGKVSDKPSVGFDLLAGVLGLEAITEAQDHLTAARTEIGKTIAEPLESLPELLKDLSGVDDDRARRVAHGLMSEPQDLKEVRHALSEAPTADRDDSARAILTRLSSLAVPDHELARTSPGDLRAAVAAVQGLRGTDAEDAARLADLLDAALTHHTGHGDGPCPVCGQGNLDASWHERTVAETSRLRERAATATAARKQLGEALARARELIQPVPAVLSAGVDGIDASAAASAWREWAALAREEDAAALADGIERLTPAVTAAVEALRSQAARRLRTIEDAWRPVAARVQNWLTMHARAEVARPRADDVRTALAWVKDQAEQLRSERLAPFRDQCARVWANLRQESNVELGPITFAGSGRTRRKLQVPVRIDDTPGGVPMLSNGELHALGLALFLPRATAPDSPFRFVVIDDPVQAMDPAKVEGLAHVLHEAAADRQVIVLTHDDRLANAVRHLMLPAMILEVTRREGSQVEIVPNQDPVRRFLDEARQVARTAALPDDLASIASTGSCRDAIEVACQRVARRRLRARAVPIAQVDERLIRARTTMERMALALFCDSSRTGEVMRTLNQLARARWAGDVLRDVREGAHQPRSDLERIIRDSGRLCDLIQATPVR